MQRNFPIPGALTPELYSVLQWLKNWKGSTESAQLEPRPPPGASLSFSLHEKARSLFLLPEETLPCGEVSALEESVLQDPFHSTKRLDHVCAVVVQVPEFPVMALMCPPERVLLQDLHTTAHWWTALYLDLLTWLNWCEEPRWWCQLTSKRPHAVSRGGHSSSTTWVQSVLLCNSDWAEPKMMFLSFRDEPSAKLPLETLNNEFFHCY